VVIADPGLIRRAGHPFHSAVGVREAARDAGLATLVLASRMSEPEIVAALSARRCFSRPVYSRADWSFSGYEAAAGRYRKEIARALWPGGRSAAAFILPTCDQTQLRALAELISRNTIPAGRAILAWLLFPPRWNSDLGAAGAAEQTAEYRDAIDRIAEANGGKEHLWLCCETEELRSHYAAAGGIEVRLCPGPSVSGASHSPELKPGNPAGPFNFVIAGHATKAKGYELLPDAIHAVREKTAGASFTIHGVAERAANPAADGVLDRLTAMGPGVTVLRHQLASDEYYRLLRSADVVLLPYRLPEYSERGSGIFTEATRLGIPVIAPSGSGFAREAISSGRAIGMKEHTAQALAEAILDALQRIEVLGRNCRAYLAEAPLDRTPSALLGDFFASAFGQRPKHNDRNG
jgi:glycosyltransferase involved in cell wall biosynthesis